MYRACLGLYIATIGNMIWNALKFLLTQILLVVKNQDVQLLEAPYYLATVAYDTTVRRKLLLVSHLAKLNCMALHKEPLKH